VTTIPTQISTSLVTLFHKNHKCVASTHESVDTLCSKNKFLSQFCDFSFLKMGICNRIVLFQKTSFPSRYFSPQKNDWLTYGSCRQRECMPLPPLTCFHLWVKLIDWRLVDD
jgi:hypothetical protein